MTKLKIILLTLIIGFGTKALCANERPDFKSLKEPAYRVGTTSDVEKRYSTIDTTEELKVGSVKQRNLPSKKTMSYGDSNLKMLSKEISDELSVDFDDMMGDLNILWGGAVTRSETIKFAIHKLSNPDEEKPNPNLVKKILKPLANMTTLAGAGFGDPLISTTAFLGGNLLGIFSVDEKELNYKFSKVSDADMIILVRKVDELQKSVVNSYCDYISERNALEMQGKILNKRKKQYNSMQSSKNESLLIADAYYREALDSYTRAQMKFYSARSVLEQLVGNEALIEFEGHLVNRRQK